jgi:CelD/BcsL family acetyltransferase involved in cellulose biosynthesis
VRHAVSEQGQFHRTPRAAHVASTASAGDGAVHAVQAITTRAEFMMLAGEWDALVERCDDQLFYRHAFLRLWLDHFGAGELRLLVMRDDRGRLEAALPLLAVNTRLFGIPVRELRAVANVHSCRFDLLADDPQTAARAFVAHLRSRRDWDVLRITDTPAYGRAPGLLAAAAEAGLPGGLWVSQHSPYRRLAAGGWNALQASLDKRFRSSLRRRRRRLQQHGVVTVERYGGGAKLDEKLAEGLALEANGWKGRAGSAIVQDPDTLDFYRSLAAHAAASGELALWFLRIDGHAIAFDFSIEHNGRLLLLKTAYDERFADCSPGQLLLEEELRDASLRGLEECDFLGPQSPAKRDWTRTVRAHCWVFLFRGSRGRLLHTLKFGVVPVVKRLAGAARRPPPRALRPHR